MIELSRMNGEKIWINPEQILWVEAKPDSILTFLDRKTLIVRETPDVIRARILEHHQKISTAGGSAQCSIPQQFSEL